MKVIIAGGSGFIGTLLAEELKAAGHDISILTRGESRSSEGMEYVQWDAESVPTQVRSADVVINLSGASIIDGAWTAKRKKVLRDSRIKTSRACLEFLEESETPPKVFINASAVGIYGDRPDEVMDEDSSPGTGFVPDLVKVWENSAQGAKTRTVILRIGVVLSRDGGAFPRMLLPFRLGVGNYFGHGRQGFPWIHYRDILESIKFAMENESLSGPVNLAAPEPISNKDFTLAMGRAMGGRLTMPVPAFMLKLAFGKRHRLLMDSQFVKPRVLLDAGYKFHFPDPEAAVRDLLGK